MRRYKVLGFKRRILGLTNYGKRLELLKSRKTRVTIRRSNKYVLIQFIEYEPKGDKVLLSVSSKGLKKFGWNHSCKNLPAAYLTGLIAGKSAKGKKMNEGILDLGRYSIVKGSILFGALKGVVDGGVNVMHSEEILPEKNRLSGADTKNKDIVLKDFEMVLLKIKGVK